MARYLKRFNRLLFSLGPSEERDVALWVGYEVDECDRDLTHIGLLAADALSDAELRERGISMFQRVAVDDYELRRRLGIE